MTPLTDRHCIPLKPGTKPLTASAVTAALPQIKAWKPDATHTALVRELEFTDFDAAMTFVNKVADLAETENHHPDIDIRWNKVTLALSSHDVGGLSENDLILAAKIDALA